MVPSATELRRLVQIVRLAVDSNAHKAILSGPLKQILKLAFPTADERRQNFDPALFRPLEHRVGDLIRRLSAHRARTGWAMRGSAARPEKSEIIVDLRYGANRGTRVAPRRLLFNRDRRGEPLDRVDIGLFHEPEELPSVGRQRLHVSPLALGIDRIKCEARLPRPGKPGDHREAVPRDPNRDVLQIVLARTAYEQKLFTHRRYDGHVIYT